MLQTYKDFVEIATGRELGAIPYKQDSAFGYKIHKDFIRPPHDCNTDHIYWTKISGGIRK
jgi:hypothetical protein